MPLPKSSKCSVIDRYDRMAAAVGPGEGPLLVVLDAKRRDEIVADVLLPPVDGWRSAYLKLRRRGSFDFPVLGVAVAARLEGDVVRDARIVLGAVASLPRPAEQAVAALVGRRLTPEVIAAVADLAAGPSKPLDNTDFTHPYRKKVTRVFVARALRAIAGLGGGAAVAETVRALVDVGVLRIGDVMAAQSKNGGGLSFEQVCLDVLAKEMSPGGKPDAARRQVILDLIRASRWG